MLRPEHIRQDMQRFINNAARELMKPVESQILKRANNGHYNATVLVPMVYSRAVAEELAERVRSFGYSVTMQPLDELEDYDHKLTISWEEVYESQRDAIRACEPVCCYRGSNRTRVGYELPRGRRERYSEGYRGEVDRG